MKKAVDITINIIFVILLLLSCIIFIPRCFGIKAYSVAGTSMEPTIHLGTLVYAKPMNFNKYKPQDIIVFKDRGNVVVHRAVGVNADEETFTTRGDANSADDLNAVALQNVEGKMIFSIPLLGYLLGVISFKITKIIAGIVLLFVLAFTSLSKNKKMGDLINGKTIIKN